MELYQHQLMEMDMSCCMHAQAWLRSRGESATQVVTADSMAEQYGVVKGTYEAVALPRVNTSVVRTDTLVKVCGSSCSWLDGCGAQGVRVSAIRTLGADKHLLRSCINVCGTHANFMCCYT